jgi:hypothetical protein
MPGSPNEGFQDRSSAAIVPAALCATALLTFGLLLISLPLWCPVHPLPMALPFRSSQVV